MKENPTGNEDVQKVPEISIIVPAYNAQNQIEKTLISLINQDYPQEHIEIIVVDNNSSDDTAKMVEKYPAVRLLHERNKQSSYAARNRGIEAAGGSIVLFTDADCEAEPDWAMEMAKLFVDGTAMGAGGRVVAAPPTNNVDRFIAGMRVFENAVPLGDTGLVSVITANAAYRRDALHKVGGFDEGMFTGGDIDLSWRIQRFVGGRIVAAPEAKVTHYHRNSLQGLYKIFRRYGYSSSQMTALYSADKTFPENRAWQLRKISDQAGALMTYVASYLYRNSVGAVRGLTHYERKEPLYWFIAEFANLVGRVRGLAATRFYIRPPKGLAKRQAIG